jgi:hypothetical protein
MGIQPSEVHNMKNPVTDSFWIYLHNTAVLRFQQCTDGDDFFVVHDYIKKPFLPLNIELHPFRFALLAAEDTHQGKEPLKSEGVQGKNRLHIFFVHFSISQY